MQLAISISMISIIWSALRLVWVAEYIDNYGKSNLSQENQENENLNPFDKHDENDGRGVDLGIGCMQGRIFLFLKV